MSYTNDSKPSGSYSIDRNGGLVLWDDAFTEWSSNVTTFVDMESETLKDSIETLGTAAGNNDAIGQTFTPSFTGTLTSAQFYIAKGGSIGGVLTGNAFAKVFAMTGTYGSSGKPTGTALATSTGTDVSGLTSSFTLTTFTFANGPTLTAGVHYCVEIDYAGGSPNSPFSRISVGVVSSGSHGGNQYDLFAGNYSFPSNEDVCFYVNCQYNSLNPTATWDSSIAYTDDSKPSGSYSNDTKPS